MQRMVTEQPAAASSLLRRQAMAAVPKEIRKGGTAPPLSARTPEALDIFEEVVRVIVDGGCRLGAQLDQRQRCVYSKVQASDKKAA